ncbi:MAG: hypothetical protein ACK5IQ_01540 [Bacteroidales bacterium]
MNTFTALSVLQWGAFIAIACVVVSTLDKKKLVGIVGIVALTAITILAWGFDLLGKNIDSNLLDDFVYVKLCFTVSLMLVSIYKYKLENRRHSKLLIYTAIAILTGAFFILRTNITTLNQ